MRVIAVTIGIVVLAGCGGTGATRSADPSPAFPVVGGVLPPSPSAVVAGESPPPLPHAVARTGTHVAPVVSAASEASRRRAAQAASAVHFVETLRATVRAALFNRDGTRAFALMDPGCTCRKELKDVIDALVKGNWHVAPYASRVTAISAASRADGTWAVLLTITTSERRILDQHGAEVYREPAGTYHDTIILRPAGESWTTLRMAPQ